jgi:sialic acid synthase SpsE
MTKSFSVDPYSIGIGHPVFVLAESGVNHNRDIAIAARTDSFSHACVRGRIALSSVGT